MTYAPKTNEQIKAEAIAAVSKYSTVADACPYPFTSCEGVIFKREFFKERTRQEEAICESNLQTQFAKSLKAGLDSIIPIDAP